MYKKFFIVLLLAAAILIGCMACKEDASPAVTLGNPTTTVPTETTLAHNSGVVDMPTGFAPPVEDDDEPATTAPTESTPVPTEPQVTEPQVTEPTVKPTTPVEDPTQPTQSVEEMTFETFMAMDPYAQTEFIKSFDAVGFHTWFQEALAEYKKEHPDFEYNGGAIELPQ